MPQYINTDGATANAVSAYTAAGRGIQGAMAQNAQSIAQIGETFAQLGRDVMAAKDKREQLAHFQRYGQSLGIPPEQMGSLATAKVAVADKLHGIAQKQLADSQMGQQNNRFANDAAQAATQRGFDVADADKKRGFAMQDQADEASRLGGAFAPVEEQEFQPINQRSEFAPAFDAPYGEPQNPSQPPMSSPAGSWETQSRNPTPMESMRRYTRSGGANIGGLSGAMDRMEPSNPARERETPEEAAAKRRATLGVEKEMGAGDFKPTPTKEPPTRNIDPLSPEGRDATIDLEKRRGELRPAGNKWTGREARLGASLQRRAESASAHLAELEKYGAPIDDAEKAERAALKKQADNLWAEVDKLTARETAGQGGVEKVAVADDPSPDELAKIQSDPTVAESWKAWTAEQKKAFLGELRKK